MKAIMRVRTMWAEMKPDVYAGQKCDQIKGRWECWAKGDIDSDVMDAVDLAAKRFPPGTRITITEPLCPNCGDLREPIFPIPVKGDLYAGPCECGFDWDQWVMDRYS